MGNLPAENTQLSKSLQFLNIGYNKLRGSISAEMARISFNSFHIESNRISGYLRVSNFSKNSQKSVYMASVNRFSGPVPADELNTYAQVNVLEGNIFSCGRYPDADPLSQEGTYSCASRGLDNVLVGWGSLTIVFTFLMLCFAAVLIAPGSLVLNTRLHKIRKEYLFVVLDWLRCSESWQSRSIFPQTAEFLRLLTRVTMVVSLVGILSLIVAVVLYTIYKIGDLGSVYKTHSEQYSYIISAAFLAGQPPAVSMLVLYLTTIALLLYLLVTRLSVSTVTRLSINSAVAESKSESLEDNSPPRSVLVWLWIRSMFVTLQPWIIVLVLSIPFLVINLVFVDISNQNRLSSLELLAFQLFISICNALDIGIVQFILRVSAKWINLGNSSNLVCLCITCVLIDLGVPIVSTVYYDSLCFKDVSVEKEPIMAYYEYEQCQIYKYNIRGQYVGCDKYEVVRENVYYQPFYLYSNQCR